jgi:hypothetical protein
MERDSSIAYLIKRTQYMETEPNLCIMMRYAFDDHSRVYTRKHIPNYGSKRLKSIFLHELEGKTFRISFAKPVSVFEEGP